MISDKSVGLSTPNSKLQNEYTMFERLLNFMGWSVQRNISNPESPHPHPNSTPAQGPSYPQATSHPPHPTQGMPQLGFSPGYLPYNMHWESQQRGSLAPSGCGNGNVISGCTGSLNVGGVTMTNNHYADGEKPCDREESPPLPNPFPPGPNGRGIF